MVEERIDEPSVSGYIVAQIAQTVRDRGIDAKQVLSPIGLNEAELAHSDSRVPLQAAWECAECAYDLCGDPCIGLEIASKVGEGYPMLRYSLRNAATLGAAFDRWGRFYGLISDHGIQSLVRGSTNGTMRCQRRTDEATPVLVEDWLVGQWMTLGRLLVGVEWVPIEVRLEHADTAAAATYLEWFGAPVSFGESCSELVIPNDALELPIVGSDASLSAVLDRHIEEVLDRRTASASFTASARKAMAKQLDGGDPSAASVAKILNVSERTLLRRLRSEGTTPTDLLRELRLELAEKYLSDPEISLTEVSYLLGYSEVSAFHRAFKRWTGRTPAQFRSSQ